MLHDEPLISIIVPYYDNGPYLLEAISSIAAQTYRNWEIVLVDDCSLNISAASIIEPFLNLNIAIASKIRIIRNQKNEGASEATNVGLRLAQGELIITLDADDRFAPQMLENCLNHMRHTESDLVMSAMRYFGDQNFTLTPKANLENLLMGEGVSPSVLSKQEVYRNLAGYRKAPLCEDIDYLLRAFSANYKISTLEEPLLEYRKHGASYSTQNKEDWPKRLSTLMELHPYLYQANANLVISGMEKRYRNLETEYNRLYCDWQKKEKFYNQFLFWHKQKERMLAYLIDWKSKIFVRN